MRADLGFQVRIYRVEQHRGSVTHQGYDRITDIHLWRVGPGAHAAIVSVTGVARASHPFTSWRTSRSKPGSNLVHNQPWRP
jgi:hypothetical protein